MAASLMMMTGALLKIGHSHGVLTSDTLSAQAAEQQTGKIIHQAGIFIKQLQECAACNVYICKLNISVVSFDLNSSIQRFHIFRNYSDTMIKQLFSNFLHLKMRFLHPNIQTDISTKRPSVKVWSSLNNLYVMCRSQNLVKTKELKMLVPAGSQSKRRLLLAAP